MKPRGRHPHHRLSSVAVNAAKPGRHADGNGLYLVVDPSGARRWVLRTVVRGTRTHLGLGGLSIVTLKEAREKAAAWRKLARDGGDPRADKAAQEARESARKISFRECAAAYVEAHTASWKNAKHVDQWTNTLETYCGPVIGALWVQEVDTPLVLRVLEPIWLTKNETATRLRPRIERVIDWATVRGHRTGDNPARWRGHLDKLLPTINRKQRIQHHPALPYQQIGDFMAKLRAEAGVPARALEFTILTVARTNESIGAKHSEIDLAVKTWTVPATRMKGKKQHRVPLSPQALRVLHEMPHHEDDVYVFAGRKKGRPQSNMSMLKLMRRMGYGQFTVHGFRASFANWSAERTSYSREVCEAALAHGLKDQTEAAYFRSDVFDRRRRLMNEWARFCDAVTGDVVPLRATK